MKYKEYLYTKYGKAEAEFLYMVYKSKKLGSFESYSDIFKITEYRCNEYEFRFLKRKKPQLRG